MHNLPVLKFHCTWRDESTNRVAGSLVTDEFSARWHFMVKLENSQLHPLIRYCILCWKYNGDILWALDVQVDMSWAPHTFSTVHPSDQIQLKRGRQTVHLICWIYKPGNKQKTKCLLKHVRKQRVEMNCVHTSDYRELYKNKAVDRNQTIQRIRSNKENRILSSTLQRYCIVNNWSINTISFT